MTRMTDSFYSRCPACDSKRRKRFQLAWECSKCHAIYGDISDAEFYSGRYIVPLFGTSTAPELERYFDFRVHRANGRVERVHGWFDEATKRVVQIG